MNLKKNISNIPGRNLSGRSIIFESDDWGSIRMPSLHAFESLKNAGLDLESLDALRYNLNDTLATSADLANLFEVLSHVKDSQGSPAVFTPVTIVANPDFGKIEQSGFEEYHYEPFTETLRKYGYADAFDVWKEGIAKHLFVPQMHGREHLNVTAWMKALRAGDSHTRMAFREKCWGFVPHIESMPGIDFQAAYLPGEPSEMDNHKIIIEDGLALFNRLFGYQAVYFVPPNGPFNNRLNEVLAKNGIRFRSAAKLQHEPLGNGKFRKVPHWLGQKDPSGIRYITRNCFFEPSQPGKNWVDSCLEDIRIAFRWHKPAVISSHRVNYIGSLNPGNRDNSLRQLRILLETIVKKWPGVEFLTTAELGERINRETI